MVRAVVIGAAGGIGQPLSLLLKNSPLVKNLALYDVVNAVGVATDLSHISSPAIVEGYTPKDDGMKKAISGADIIVIPAGVPRKPGMTRDDLFNTNASIVRDIATAIAASAPKAFILVISNPVNSTVPIVAEVMKKHGVFDPKRLFGVTTLDVVRASQFCAENASGLEAPSVRVPVIGGHSGITIVPLLSQIQPPTNFSQEVLEKLTNRIQFGGDEVVKAKDGAGSATLSMAWAGYRFTEAIIQAMNGKTGIIEPSYVFLEADPQGGAQVRKELGSEISFFSAPVELGPQGVHKIHSIGKLSDYEAKLVKAAVPELEKNIAKGVEFLQAKM